MIAKTSAVEDYVYRGAELKDVCVWDYFSRIEKVSKKGDDRRHKKYGTDDSSDTHEADCTNESGSHKDDGLETNESEVFEIIPDDLRDVLWDLHYHPNLLLANRHRRRPRVDFDVSHNDHRTHMMSIVFSSKDVELE